MLKFTGQESNRYVLEKVVEQLEYGIDCYILIQSLKAFLKHKENIWDEVDKLTLAARNGDREAARKLITKLAETNDGV